MTKDKGKYKISPKGKKKLLFQKKSKDTVKLPLIGKTIFLDVKEAKHQKKLQTDLKRLGATIEEFVSKDINYLITSQPRPKVRKDNKDNETVPSPFNCDPSPSPGNVEDSKASTVTRGKALAERARINSRETTTMLDNAEKWGVKIVGLDAAYKWIDKANRDFKHQLKDVEKNEKAIQKHRIHNAKFKLLDKPFIKFESVDYNYRPVSEDALSWPNFDVHTPRGSCPFDGTILKGDDRGELPAAQVDIPSENTPQEEKDGIESNSTKPTVDSNTVNLSVEKGTKKSEGDGCGGWKVLTAGELRRRAEQKRRQRKKRGHCECCKMKYEDLDKHVREEQHRLYVKEKSNYQHLDSLIGSVPPTAEFLRRWILASVSKSNSPKNNSDRDGNNSKQTLSQPKSPRRTKRHNSGDNNSPGKENQKSVASAGITRQRSNSVSKDKIRPSTRHPVKESEIEKIGAVNILKDENESLSLRRSPRKSCDVSVVSDKTFSPRKSQRVYSLASPEKTLSKLRQSPRKLFSPVKSKDRKILGELPVSPYKLSHESKSDQLVDSESSSKEAVNDDSVNVLDKTADFVNDKTTPNEDTIAEVVQRPAVCVDEGSQEVQCVTEELKSLLDFSKTRANRSGTSDDFEVSLIRTLDNIKLPGDVSTDNKQESRNIKQDNLEESDKENSSGGVKKVSNKMEKDKNTAKQIINDKLLDLRRSPRKQFKQEMNEDEIKQDKSDISEESDKENNIESVTKGLNKKAKEKNTAAARQNINDRLLDLRRSPRKQSKQETNCENQSISVEKGTGDRLNTGDNLADTSFSNLYSDIPSDFQSFGPHGEILMFSKTLAERIKERGKRKGLVGSYNINLITQSAMSPRNSFTNSPQSYKHNREKKISVVSPNQKACTKTKTSAVVASRRICRKYKNNRNINQNKCKGKDISANFVNNIESDETKMMNESLTPKIKDKGGKKYWYYEIETEESSSGLDEKLKSLPKIIQDLHTSWNDCNDTPEDGTGRKLRRGTRNYYGEIDHLSQALALRNSNHCTAGNSKNQKTPKGNKLGKMNVSNSVLEVSKPGMITEAQLSDGTKPCNETKPKNTDMSSVKHAQMNRKNSKKDKKTKPRQRVNRFWEFVIDNDVENKEEVDESLHKELKNLKVPWNNLSDIKSIDSKRRSRSMDINYNENYVDKELKKETNLILKSNTNDQLKNENINDQVEHSENNILGKESVPEAFSHVGKDTNSFDKNLNTNKDTETTSSGIKQKQRGRKYWDYVIEAEQEVPDIDESLPKEIRMLQIPWLNHKDIQTTDTKRRSRSIDVNYRETSSEREPKQGKDVSSAFNRDINDKKLKTKSEAKTIHDIGKLRDKIIENKKRIKNRITCSHKTETGFKDNVRNSDTIQAAKDRECGNSSSYYGEINEIKTIDSNMRKNKDSRVPETKNANEGLQRVEHQDPQKQVGVINKSQENKAFFNDSQKCEIPGDKKGKIEFKTNENVLEIDLNVHNKSINSRQTSKHCKVIVDPKSPDKGKSKERSPVKCVNVMESEDSETVHVDGRSMSPVFIRSPVCNSVGKKRVSNKVALQRKDREQQHTGKVNVEKSVQSNTPEKKANSMFKFSQSPRKFKSPVKSPEPMMISSPRSGYSTSPRELRRKRWKRKTQSSDSESSPNSQVGKRRRLDKLKYVINQEKAPDSETKPEMFSNENVEIISEESKVNVLGNHNVSCKGAAQATADNSFTLKWQQVSLNSSACEDGRKVKLNNSWTLISDRSASKLLGSEDDDHQSFNGFTEDDVENTHPSDLSYEEHSEIELLSSDHEWSIEEENTTEKEEEFSKFVPTFSSPGKASDTDWEMNVDSFMKNRVNNNQSVLSVTSPWRSPRRKSQNTVTSPLKVTPVKKRTSNFLSRLNGSENDKNSCNPDREMVDEEIEFNHRSPQKFKCNFSPLRAENGVIMGHARKQVTSTPSQVKNPKSRDKNFSGLVFNLNDAANCDSGSNEPSLGQDYRILKKKADTPKSFSLKYEASPEKKKKKGKISMQV